MSLKPSNNPIWSSFVGETLAVKQEKGNRHDHFAVAVIQRQSWPAVTMIVSRIPREFFPVTIVVAMRHAMNIKSICITLPASIVINVY